MSISGWCSSSSATSDTAFTKSMASAKSSNSKVRSICFFSSSHSGIFFRRTFSSSVFIKSAITGQRVAPEICFAMPKSRGLFRALNCSGGADAGRVQSPPVQLTSTNAAKVLGGIENFHRAVARLFRELRPIAQHLFHCSFRFAGIADKTESALPRHIFFRASVLGYDGQAVRQESRRQIDQQTSQP